MPATDWRGLGGHCPTLVRLGGARVWPGPRGPGHTQWMSWSGARLEGRGTVAHRDLARLRLLGHRDGERAVLDVEVDGRGVDARQVQGRDERVAPAVQVERHDRADRAHELHVA